MAKAKNIIHLLTPEGEALQRDPQIIPWNVYPRPQMKRDSFLCLNGDWEVTVNGGAPRPIRVPFCPESILSGMCMPPSASVTMDYFKTFTLPKDFNKGRVILHFGGVDACANIIVNGDRVGFHQGGYEAFSFDITDHLQSENQLTVEVWDNLRTHTLPYGKQRADRGGMWYTPVSGIWQTVWLESVPETYVKSLRIDTDGDTATILAEGATDGTVTVTTPAGKLTFPLAEGKATVKIPSPRYWCPEDPYLYEFTLEAGEDRVSSYFALRTLEIKQVGGIPRLCLNGRPYFLHALLDQGYWSDGIYTPATPDGYEKDILAMKELGFNTLRMPRRSQS